MTADEFTAWRKHLGLSGRKAAAALGVSKNTITAYERGKWGIPKTVALACSAVANQLRPWPIA
jgi:transcriptional regulator with XRE-family HTH domain